MDSPKILRVGRWASPSVTRPDLPGDTGTDQFNQESRARANAAPRVTAGCAEEGTDAARLKEVAQGASLPKGGSSNDAAFGRCTRWYTSEPRSRVAIKDNRVVRKTIGRSLQRHIQKSATSNCDGYESRRCLECLSTVWVTTTIEDMERTVPRATPVTHLDTTCGRQDSRK